MVRVEALVGLELDSRMGLGLSGEPFTPRDIRGTTMICLVNVTPHCELFYLFFFPLSIPY